MDNNQPPYDQGKTLVYRVARMTRMLRNSMRELELDEGVVKASELIPDAKERLSYVATMTEQAAEKTLSAVESTRPLQRQIIECSDALQEIIRQSSDESLKGRALVDLEVMSSHAADTQKQLMEIVMAQDYQDLTGQVLKRLMDVIHDLESELVGILLEHVEEPRREEIKKSLIKKNGMTGDDNSRYLNGPMIESTRTEGAAASQDDVDSLLDSFDL